MPPSIFPTGTTIYNPDKTYNSYVLYDGRDGRSFLIDMNGNFVHTWPYTGFPVEMIDPEINDGERGHIICQKEPEIYSCENLLIVDWDANIIWEWGEKAPGGKARQNHDLSPLPNGNLLIVAFTETTIPDISDESISDQAIYEISREGDIVWKWVSSEHIEELGFIGEKKELQLEQPKDLKPPLGPKDQESKIFNPKELGPALIFIIIAIVGIHFLFFYNWRRKKEIPRVKEKEHGSPRKDVVMWDDGILEPVQRTPPKER